MLLGNLVYHYLKRGLQLEAISHPAILGLLLVILGFQTFCFTLLMEMAKRVISRSSAVSLRAHESYGQHGLTPGRSGWECGYLSEQFAGICPAETIWRCWNSVAAIAPPS